MKNIEHIIDHAEQQANARGVRLTDKRKKVLSTLLRSEKAQSAYELIDTYKAEFDEALPAMSMYRILDFLQSEHLIHKLELANKYIACEHITCDHKHEVSQFLICGQCQKVEEVTIKQATIDELKKNIEDAGFHLSSQQLEMNCICKKCNTKTV